MLENGEHMKESEYKCMNEIKLEGTSNIKIWIRKKNEI